MTDFIHTGYYYPTLTTTDDPNLKVIEIDNGYSWTMNFYVLNKLIDIINMEHLNGTELHPLVKELNVFNEDNIIIGTVEERIKNALENYVPDSVLSAFEISSLDIKQILSIFVF